jgi:thiamine biosynthesis protein ThiS
MGCGGYPLLAVKLIFSVALYLYGRIGAMKLTINGEEKSFAGELALSALVEKLGMKADRVAIELNRDIVPRDRWASTLLHEGDSLEIVQFVGGGKARRRSTQMNADHQKF